VPSPASRTFSSTGRVDHPDTLTTRADVAWWRGEAGDRAGAVEAYERLLMDRLRVLGPDDPDIDTTRQALAHWRTLAGTPMSETRTKSCPSAAPTTRTTRLSPATFHTGAARSAIRALPHERKPTSFIGPSCSARRGAVALADCMIKAGLSSEVTDTRRPLQLAQPKSTEC
jgi:hypothetical protein